MGRKRVIFTFCVVFLVILELTSVFLMYKSVSVNETKLHDVKLKDNSQDEHNMFAIMIGQSDGSYIESESNTLPLKEAGYIFNSEKSGCINNKGQKLTGILSYRNNMVKAEISETTYCYIYFDIISEGDFCIERGVTNFKDCLLVMEDYSYDTEEAIDYIANKGSATPSMVAPTVKYKEVVESVTNEDGIINSTTNFSFGTSYTFDETTGRFTLRNYVTTIMSDDYLEYYTCGSAYTLNITCSKMYKVKAYKVSGLNYIITEADVYTFKAVDTFDSEIGLYTANDADGVSYFYRGAVKNNYVSYGGFIWRIIRINGNGSIRMIYAGTSTSDTGENLSIGTSAYNTLKTDPTYVGYKYNEDFVERETTITFNLTVMENRVYYYGSGYEATGDGRFKLTGNIKSGLWKDVYEDVIENYPYTCWGTSSTSKCYNMAHIISYGSEKKANVYYITNNSKDYASTLINNIDSTIKIKIDNWYESNIKDKTDEEGNLLSEYLSDEIFCNDRSIYSGSGYLAAPTTFYNGFYRSETKKPGLLCNQDSDKFSVANGNLTYPIALITADEVVLSGGKYNSVNADYYLYSGQRYWTMTPYAFNINTNAYVYYIDEYGALMRGYPVSTTIGVRPVINLSADVKIVKGTGTADNPYLLSIS